MTPNPPIKGHRLLHEGHSVRHIDPVTEMYDGWSYGCECGAQPDRSQSINGTKHWHRQHKADLRRVAQIGVYIAALATEFSPWSFTHEATP